MPKSLSPEDEREYRELAEWTASELARGRSKAELVQALVEDDEWDQGVADWFVGQVEAAPPPDPTKDFIVAALAAGVGAVATYATYTSGDAGGRYLVFWGPVVFGGWRFLNGAASFLKYPSARTGTALVSGLLAASILVAAVITLGSAITA